MLVILLGFPVRCQSKNLHFWHHLASENDVSHTLLKLSRARLLRKVALPSRAIPYSFDTQVTLILILIDVQYSQNAVFTFGKDLNHQNHSSSGSHHQVEKSPPAKFLIPPPNVGEFTSTPTPLLLFGKPCHVRSTSKWWLLQILNVIIWKSSVIKLINKWCYTLQI